MKELACLVVLLLGCSSLFGQTYDVITGSTFTDGGGNPLANGSIVFLPVLNTGNPLNAKIGGGGQMLSAPRNLPDREWLHYYAAQRRNVQAGRHRQFEPCEFLLQRHGNGHRRADNLPALSVHAAASLGHELVHHR